MFTDTTTGQNLVRFPTSATCGSRNAIRIKPRRRLGPRRLGHVLAGLVAGLAMLAVLVTPLASAQGAQGDEITQGSKITRVCLDRAQMLDTLITEYGEQLSEVHAIKGKGLMEFHVSPRFGTWTAILTKADGISCVLAVGEGIDPAKIMVLAAGTRI